MTAIANCNAMYNVDDVNKRFMEWTDIHIMGNHKNLTDLFTYSC